MTRVDDDAHHIRAVKGSRWTLCKQKAAELNTLPADTMVWPDGNAACWTCWDERRAVVPTRGAGAMNGGGRILRRFGTLLVLQTARFLGTTLDRMCGIVGGKD